MVPDQQNEQGSQLFACMALTLSDTKPLSYDRVVTCGDMCHIAMQGGEMRARGPRDDSRAKDPALDSLGRTAGAQSEQMAENGVQAALRVGFQPNLPCLL